MEKKVRVLEVFGEPISNGGQESFVINIVQHINHEHLAIDMLTPYYCDNSYYEDIVKSFGGTIYTFGLSFEPVRAVSISMIKLMRFSRSILMMWCIFTAEVFLFCALWHICKEKPCEEDHCTFPLCSGAQDVKIPSDQDGVLPIYHECTDGLLCLFCGSR